MKLTLPRFGLDEVEIDPQTLIEFPNELSGFEGCRLFKLFHSGNEPLIFWLQSIDDSSVVFSLTAPESLRVSYEMTMSDEELSSLRFEPGDELQVAVILARQEGSLIAPQGAIVANYTSPIVINVTRQMALQKIVQQSEFSFHPLQPLPEAMEELMQAMLGGNETAPIPRAASDSACSLAL